LAKNLGIATKPRFASIPPVLLQDTFERFQEFLTNERVLNAETLLLFTKKGWKKCNLPVGIKMQIEILIERQQLQDTSIATLSIQELTISSSNVLATPTNQESMMAQGRMRVHTGDGRVFEVDRYCPHKRADLNRAAVNGTIIDCPKHHWKFDLANGGVCINGKWPCSLNATLLEW
jgi:nitrite reductase/ring-hydroxylating ferredoxin subunit